jgi:hypothetical protein
VQADYEGRLRDRRLRIKAEALPYSSCHINDMLDALWEANFILRYEVAERWIVHAAFEIAALSAGIVMPRASREPVMRWEWNS